MLKAQSVIQNPVRPDLPGAPVDSSISSTYFNMWKSKKPISLVQIWRKIVLSGIFLVVGSFLIAVFFLYLNQQRLSESGDNRYKFYLLSTNGIKATGFQPFRFSVMYYNLPSDF
jgi:formate/nitrite transporter FocA (FNT family)